jgi:ABC-2 type transport system permease protein
LHIISDSNSKVIQELDIPSDNGLSKPVGFLQVVKAATLVNFNINKRYPAQIIGGLVQVFLFIVFFGFFASAVTFTTLGDNDVFLFFLGGLLLVFFTDIALWTPVQAVTRDLYNGTMEALYFSPATRTGRYGYYIGYIFGEAIITGFLLVIPMFTAIIIVSGAPFGDLTMILVASVVTIASLMAMGVLFSLMAILWKQVSGLTGLIGVVMQFLTGAFIPVQALPGPVQFIAYLMPQTYGMDLVRYYSFGGSWQTILPIELEWLMIGVYALIYTLVALYLLKKVEKFSKTKGLHLL